MRKAKYFWFPLCVLVLLAIWIPFQLTEFTTQSLIQEDNLTFTDRTEEILRMVPDSSHERHRWIDLAQVPPQQVHAFLAAEDKRFYSHFGVDPIALVRAALSNLLQGQVVSGASTLTQQMVRQIYPRPRTLLGKSSEMIRAIKAEWALTKEEILEQYLNRVPMGNNLVGISIAANTYFNKVVGELTLSECALLAALPKAPGSLNPFKKDRSRLTGRRNWILKRMMILGFISQDEFKFATQDPIKVFPRQFPFECPHLLTRLSPERDQEGEQSKVTTIELSLQKNVERILHSHQQRLAHLRAQQAAVLVVRNSGREVLAYCGSLEWAQLNQGFNDGVIALRSPGSTLKPFLYGLALDSGFLPTTLLEDTRRRYPSLHGDYYPRNYNRQEYGPTTIRTALGNSLNLSAVQMIRLVGTQPFFDFLKILSLVNHPENNADYYGLGLAIGNPEVTLEQLVTAFTMLADKGTYRPLRYLMNAPQSPGVELLSPEAAFIITDILSDPNARLLTFAGNAELDFPYRVAWKTGTSTHYRDGWIIGYTPEYTVGVWVGNFDGSSMDLLGGARGAGPIFADIIKSLYQDQAPSTWSVPIGVIQQKICGHSGMLPTPNCPAQKLEWFIKDSQPTELCTYHRTGGSPTARVGAPGHHTLDSPFAGWIYDRLDKGISEPYRLNPERGDSTSTSQGKVEIIYPLPDDRFILDSYSERTATHAVMAGILLEARVTGKVKEIIWAIDGEELARVGPPYRTQWIPQKGSHRITAINPNGSADQIQVLIE